MRKPLNIDLRDYFTVKHQTSYMWISLKEWLEQHVEGLYYTTECTVEFEKESDALFFKLGYKQ